MPPFDVYDAFDRDGKLPDELSSAKWLKNGAPVSTVDAGKTLTQALVKLEALYKKVNTGDLRPAKGKVFESLDDLESAEKQAKSAYRSTVVPLVSQVIEVRKQALAVSKLCQANARVPKAIAVLAVEMAKAADQVADDLKDLSTIFKPFDEARKGLVKGAGQLRKTLGPHLQALGKGLDQCLKTPSREVWDRLCRLPCKAVHNTVKNTPQLKDEFWAVWKVHDGDSFSHALQVAEKSASKDPKAKQKLEEIITRMCKDLKKEAAQLDKFLG
jgi:hypothetical protein